MNIAHRNWQGMRSGLVAAALSWGVFGIAPMAQAQIFMSPAQEKETGAAEHKKITPQFGGVYSEGKVSAYVAALGQKLAAKSDDPAIGYTFTLLNSPVVNAFALPGGYVYVTRGLMALANSEAELGGVLGHEIGHVTGHHTAKRYDRQIGTSILGAVLGAVTGSQIVGQLANVGAQAYVAGFSRSQEYEADLKGVRTLARTGYDPYAQADFLDTLRLEEQLSSKLSGVERSRFQFFATHPNTADRVQKAAAEAEKQGAAAPNQKPRNRDQYLTQVDGIIYGDDPKEGMVRGRTFLHPDLKLRFTFPQGYEIQNSSQNVAAQAQDGSLIIFDGRKVAAGTDPASYIQGDFAQEIQATPDNIQNFDVNGMRAASGHAEGQTNDGPVAVELVAIRFSSDQMYRFMFVTAPDGFAAGEPVFRQTVQSFKRLSAQEAVEVKPLRVHVVTAGPGDTVQSLSNRMAFETYKEDRFRVLNRINANEGVRAGARYKIIQ